MPLLGLDEVCALHALDVCLDLILREQIDTLLRNFLKLFGRYKHSLEPLLRVHLHSLRVPALINILLFELGLDFETCGGGLWLVLAVLDADCLLHVHGEGPFTFHLKDQDLQVFLAAERMLFIHYLLLKLLLLLLLIATLLQKLDGLPQPVDFSNAILMVAGVVVMPKAVLILR